MLMRAFGATGAYMGALLRAFIKTLAERHHAMVILDAPNSRAAEFREFWQAGQVLVLSRS